MYFKLLTLLNMVIDECSSTDVTYLYLNTLGISRNTVKLLIFKYETDINYQMSTYLF